jgi:hypothetical protein
MKKFLLMSVIYATLVLPSLAARERNPVRGVKRALSMSLVFNLLYTFAILVIWLQMED